MRGRRYSINGTVNIASPSKSLIVLSSTTAIEPHIYTITFGSQDTPADSGIEWDIQRFTAAGTSTATTPANLGPTTTAATAVSGKTCTVEPTYTANTVLWRTALNQRATHTVVFDPEGALVLPATANNGAGMFPVHASSTVAVVTNWHYLE